MSEQVNMSAHSNTKRYLLASVSALALIAAGPTAATAESDRPAIWFEAGYQLDQLSDGQESFAPPFVTTLLENPFTPPGKVQQPPRYSFGQEGKLSFAPDGSDWVFSAGVRFGRADSSHSSHEETTPPSPHFVLRNPPGHQYFDQPVKPLAQRFATTTSQIRNDYVIADFEAGRDVGLGRFGAFGNSTFNAGVRFAQFNSRSKSRIDSDPDFSVLYQVFTFGYYHSIYEKFPEQVWNLYSGRITATHSFHGIGPSVEWDANATLAGNPDAGAITLDWSLNGALLFGRQKVAAHHETMAHHRSFFFSGNNPLPALYPTAIHDVARSRSVVVPDVGGLAGLSLRYSNAKISLGYRADFFFNAMDGGIDTRKDENRGFFGPFASISIGVGGSSN